MSTPQTPPGAVTGRPVEGAPGRMATPAAASPALRPHPSTGHPRPPLVMVDAPPAQCPSCGRMTMHVAPGGQARHGGDEVLRCTSCGLICAAANLRHVAAAIATHRRAHRANRDALAAGLTPVTTRGGPRASLVILDEAREVALMLPAGTSGGGAS